MSDAALDELVAAVLQVPKYRHLAPSLVRRVARRELEQVGRQGKAALKATKTKLHQLSGAYHAPKMPYDAWLAALKAASMTEKRGLCRQMMAQHASTAERLPILDDFYARLLGYLPQIRQVLDVACGLNPLSLPWMPLAADATYFACEVDQAMVAFLNQVLPLLQVKGEVTWLDVATEVPTARVDLALIFKLLPLLDQLDSEAGLRLLRGLQARYILVSFPTHSLGGRNKGMAANYGAAFSALAQAEGWRWRQIDFATELVFLVEKG